MNAFMRDDRLTDRHRDFVRALPAVDTLGVSFFAIVGLQMLAAGAVLANKSDPDCPAWWIDAAAYAVTASVLMSLSAAVMSVILAVTFQLVASAPLDDIVPGDHVVFDAVCNCAAIFRGDPQWRVSRAACAVASALVVAACLVGGCTQAGVTVAGAELVSYLGMHVTRDAVVAAVARLKLPTSGGGTR